MYEKFFGLTANPFGMKPDLKFYFHTESHKEAYAGLTYGISERRGLMTLVGDVGTGKTLLLEAILQFRDPSAITISVGRTTIDREELLRIILHDLYASHGPRGTEEPRETGSSSVKGSRIARLSRVELINEVCAFLMREVSVYQPSPLLIIDEAQNLSVDVLEEVRLLINLEDSRKKVLQLILAGQPELEEKLSRSDLQRLRRRIAVSARLERLSLAETSGYIDFRLEAAGRSRRGLFTKEAVEAIWAESKGSPRTINILSDKALLIAFAEGAKEVEGKAAAEAVQDIKSPRFREISSKKPGTYILTGRTTYGRAEDETSTPVTKRSHRSRVG
jgi:type II secretory pathway predicted ATPase ExeA